MATAKETKNLTINDKLSAIQTKIKAPKNLYNSFGKYNYRNAESILEAVKPVRAGDLVISMRRSRPTSSVISSHSLAVRPSHQMIERRRTLPFSSSMTRPCI